MKSQQSWQGNSISQHYFAVHPLTFLLPNPHPSQFTLYFEKNLQIITKHYAPAPDAHRHFPLPQAITHFRMTSDKVLDYQWSIYSQRPHAVEEFIQTQRISLKNEWSAYLKQGNSVFESAVQFKNVKGKLTYLIVIGKSNQELMDKVISFMREKSEPNDEKVQIRMVDKPVGQRNLKEAIKPKIEDMSIRNIQADKTQKQRTTGDEKAQTIPIQPLRQDPGLNTFEENMDNLAVEPDMIKLSQSQLEICQQIEKEVQQHQHKTNAILLEQQEVPVTDPAERDSIPSRNSLQPVTSLPPKQITIVNSQLLNSRQEVVKPIWKSNKVIALGIILFAILAWLLKNETNSPVKPLKEKKPKEQKQTKKGKTKNRNT